MSTKDLIPLGKPGNEEHDKAVRSKIKGSASDRRKISQRIAGLKKAKPENVEKKLLALITDPKISALEILKLAEEVKNLDLLPAVKIQLINTLIKAHQTIFGTKTFNVNMNMTPTSAKSMNEIYLEVLNERNIKERKGNTEGSAAE